MAEAPKCSEAYCDVFDVYVGYNRSNHAAFIRGVTASLREHDTCIVTELINVVFST